MAEFPSLGSANGRQFTSEVKQIIELWLGQRGTGVDKVLTIGDLVDAGLITTRTVSGKISLDTAAPGIIPGDGDGTGTLPIPDTPTGLTASGALGGVNLSWDAASLDYYSYTEVLRSSTNDAGTATVVGRPIFNVHRDELWQGGVFYYWIRFVTNDGVSSRTGALNSASGTVATVGTSSEFILSDVLTIPWKASTAYSDNGANAPDYVVPTPANRGVYWFYIDSGDAGTSGTTEPDWSTISGAGQTIGDGTATWTSIAAGTFDVPFIIGEVGGVPAVVMDALTYIADATITNAKIGDLAADKITTGDLTATLTINGGAIYGGIVGTSSGVGYRALMSSLDTYMFWAGTGTKNDANALFYVKNDGTAKFSGAVTFGSGTSGYSNISGIPTQLSDVNGTEGTKLTGISTGATVGATWGTDITNEPVDLGDINATEGTKLTGIATGADVTSANTSADTSAVNGLAAASISGWSHTSDTTKIDGGDIYTNSITAASIAASTITATEINVTELSAISADMGNLTAGTIQSSNFLTTGSYITTAPSQGQNGDVTGLTKANPGVVTTSSAHGLSTSDKVWLKDIGGMVEILTLAKDYTITVLTTTTFEIDQNTSGYTTYTTGGTFEEVNDSYTLNLVDTTDFSTSGGGIISGTTNDLDVFTWTGKTSTTLTGCNSVLGNPINSSVVPDDKKTILISESANEMRFYGDRGDGTVEGLATIGITSNEGDDVIALFGTWNSGNSRTALKAYTDTGIGIEVVSLSGSPLSAQGGGSSNPAGYFYNGDSSTSTKAVNASAPSGTNYHSILGSNSIGHLFLQGYAAGAPTHTAAKGTLWTTSAAIMYINTDGSTTWQKIGAQ